MVLLVVALAVALQRRLQSDNRKRFVRPVATSTDNRRCFMQGVAKNGRGSFLRRTLSQAELGWTHRSLDGARFGL